MDNFHYRLIDWMSHSALMSNQSSETIVRIRVTQMRYGISFTNKVERAIREERMVHTLCRMINRAE